MAHFPIFHVGSNSPSYTFFSAVCAVFAEILTATASLKGAIAREDEEEQ